MSPLNAPPLRGYTDEQRVDNWDEGLIWSQNTTVGAGPYTSTVQDVSRYAYLGGVIGVGSSDASVSIIWYEDQAATIVLASRKFVLSHLITNLAQPRLPNLGPFVQITVTSLVGANFSLLAKLFGTNRVHPLEFIPINPVIMSQQSAAIGASATVITYPIDYYAGPAQLVLEANVSIQPIAQFLDLSGNWDSFWVVPPIAASVWTPYTLVIPPNAWRLEVANQTAGAGLFSAILTPPTTGAM